MAWRNCEQYSLEKCGSGKPCQFNGPVNYHCSGRMLPEEKEESPMPKKSSTKMRVERKKRHVAAASDNVQAVQVGSTEEIKHLSAVQLVDRIVEKDREINRLSGELDWEQRYRESAIEQLRLTSFTAEGFSVHFGWSEDTDGPLARITVNVPDKAGEFHHVDVMLDNLRDLAKWLNEQLTREYI